jgi:hypothetical protein
MVGDLGVVVCLYVFVRLVELAARPKGQIHTAVIVLAVVAALVTAFLGLDVLLASLRGAQPSIR